MSFDFVDLQDQNKGRLKNTFVLVCNSNIITDYSDTKSFQIISGLIAHSPAQVGCVYRSPAQCLTVGRRNTRAAAGAAVALGGRTSSAAETEHGRALRGVPRVPWIKYTYIHSCMIVAHLSEGDVSMIMRSQTM